MKRFPVTMMITKKLISDSHTRHVNVMIAIDPAGQDWFIYREYRDHYILVRVEDAEKDGLLGMIVASEGNN